MNKVITKQLVEQWKTVSQQAGVFEDQIVNRIDYIVKTIFKTFDQKLEYWYFYGAGEGEVGTLRINDDYFSVITELGRNRNRDYDSQQMVILLKDGSEWGFDGSYPTRWLFEDFEKELIDGKKKFEEKEIARKLKQKEISAAKEQEDESLIEAAKKKLSKKELAAIRRSL